MNRRYSAVSEVPVADPEEALTPFSAILEFDADCWGIHDATTNGPQDFALVDLRGLAAFEREHIPGAVSLRMVG